MRFEEMNHFTDVVKRGPDVGQPFWPLAFEHGTAESTFTPRDPVDDFQDATLPKISEPDGEPFQFSKEAYMLPPSPPILGPHE